MSLAASFSAVAIAPYFSYWVRRVWDVCEVELAPYGQVLELLCGYRGARGEFRGQALGQRVRDAAVVLIRPEDLLRGEDGRPSGGARALSRGREHAQAIAHALGAGERLGLVALVGVVAASPRVQADAAIAAFDGWVRASLQVAVRGAPTATWLDLERATAVYDVVDVHDEYRDDLAHIPFSDEYMAATATMAVRTLRALWVAPRKAIVLDCDNTLWGGACGEEPIEELDAGGPYRVLRELMLEQARAGRLLCLASRNRGVDVRRAFVRCAAPLRWKQIAAHRISSGNKPEALRSLALELGIAINALVFVDDDPVECAAVRAALPDVAVVELPREPAKIPRALDHVWEFDTAAVTHEDRMRGDSYALEARRRRERERAPSLEAFIAGLKVRVRVSDLKRDDAERAEQLLVRTNQFNLTGARCSADELLRLHARADTEVAVVRVHDRIGDYGLVGVLGLALAVPCAEVLLWALSCRVLQRGVERRILDHVVRRALVAGCTEVAVAFRETGRNGVAREFLERFIESEGRLRVADGSCRYVLALNAVLRGCGGGV